MVNEISDSHEDVGASDRGKGPENDQGHTVVIEVNGADHQIRPGKWTVSDFKAYLGIDPAKVLAEIKPQGLKDLDDEGSIGVHEKQKFMTHARSGGAS